MAVESFQFRHLFEQFVKAEALQRSCFRILDHADGASRIEQQHGRFLLFCHKPEFCQKVCYSSDKDIKIG